VRVIWLNNTVVNPLAFPSSRNHACPPQVGKMTGDLWLVCLQNFYKKTDTNFVFSHKVNQSQTRPIRQRSKEQRDAIFPASHGVLRLPFRGLVITISLSEEFLIHTEIHIEFDSKTPDISIRILASKTTG
jgi:hypothetical protein